MRTEASVRAWVRTWVAVWVCAWGAGAVEGAPARAAAVARQAVTTGAPKSVQASAVFTPAPDARPRRPIPCNNVWASDTLYVADRKVYDVRLSDTEVVDDPRCQLRGHEVPLRTAFHLKGLRNVTLDFEGATLRLHGKIQPFLVDSCTNVTVKNVEVLYDRSPYTQGEVVSVSERELVLRIGKDFPYRVRDGFLDILSETWTNTTLNVNPKFIQFFDGKTRRGTCITLAAYGRDIVMDPKLPWAASSLRFGKVSERDGLLVLGSEKPIRPIYGQVQPGQIAVLTHEPRNLSNFHALYSRNLTIANYRILNGFGMGIFPFRCENLTLDGVRMMYDEKSPSVIANAADGIHAFACSGSFKVRNCIVEGTIDDALNVHANYYVVTEIKDGEIIADTGLEPNAETPLFAPGDRIRVYRGLTLDPAADYEIRAIRPLDKKHVAFRLDRPAEKHAARDAIENLSAQCALTISNCQFLKSNTHLRLQSRGQMLIENCVTELPFCLTGDMNYWFESSPCDDLTIRGCTFRGGRAQVRASPESFNPTAAARYYHGRVWIEDCVFDSTSPVSMNHTREVVLKRCRTSGGKPITPPNPNGGHVTFVK